MSNRSPLFAWLFVLALLLGVSGLPLPVNAAPGVTTLVSVHPAAATFASGETLTVEVWVENVLDLYGGDIQLQFDPLAFQVLDAHPSLPGVQVRLRSDLLQPGIVIHREADNNLGTVWYAATQVYPAEPVSGSGALFEFNLIARTNGDYPLQVSSVQLSTQGADPIPADTLGALYSLQGYRNYLPFIPITAP